MNDPEGATTEGANASARLEEIAWTVGWSKEQTAGAEDWAAVGDMCLNPPTPPTPAAPPAQVAVPAPIQPGTPVIFQTSGAPPTAIMPGGKYKFAKRTRDGLKLRNNKGEEFPPQEIEVTTVNVTNKTCTVKTVKDNKPVVDIRSKQPVDVKFEWLE